MIGDVRQVPVKRAEDTWERVTGDGGVRGVGAVRYDRIGGWNVNVAVMELVWEEPLEGELRRRICAALRSAGGVEWAVAGIAWGA